MFLRGKSELAKLIPRVKCSPHSKKRTFDANTEPDFYAMAPLPEPAKRVEKARRLHPDQSATSVGHSSGHVLSVGPSLQAAVPAAAAPAFAGYHHAQTSLTSAVLANSDFTTQPTSLPAVGSNLSRQPLPLRGMMTTARSASVSESAYSTGLPYGARSSQHEAILVMRDGARTAHQRGLDPTTNAFAVPYATPSNAFGQNSLIENTLAFPLPLHAPLSSHTGSTELPAAKRFRPNNDALPQFVPRSRDDTANEPLHDVDVSSDWLEKTDFNTFW
jgi:hypothetical protein